MIPALQPIANHLWQSTLFAAAAGLLTLVFRKHRAPVRYSLWLAASLKFLIPLSLLVAAAGSLVPRAATTPAAPASWAPVIGQISDPFPVAAEARNAAPSPHSSSSLVLTLLIAAWLCGVAANVLAWGRQWRRVRTTLQTASRLPFDAPIPVMSAHTDLEPGVFGIWRPVLLLPAGITNHLNPQQLEAILAHELSHVRRRDNLAASLHMLVETLFWFHPLVWWIGLRLIDEREQACDEAVLRQVGDPEPYAEGILGVCKFYAQSPACVAGVTGANLKKRIEAIMTRHVGKRLRLGGKLVLASAALAAAAVPLIVAITCPARAQSTAANTGAFEVVSIKPNTDPNSRAIGWDTHAGGRFHATGLPIKLLIAAAYNVPFQSQRLAGGPDWLMADRYDVDAAAPQGAIPPSVAGKALEARIRPMLQAMLADRFKLVMRHETKDMPVYAITVGKGGPKLKAAGVQEADCGTDAAKDLDCHNLGGGMGRGMHGRAVDLDDVALFASNWSDRPIVNRTDVAGLFAIDTEGWTPMHPLQPRTDGKPDPEAESFADPSRPTIFMIFSRLGLNLESSKGPVDTYIIESIARPTAN
jgi:uncharacterized protein (TIGR03435 family)